MLAGQRPPLSCRTSPPLGGDRMSSPLSPIASAAITNTAGKARSRELAISPLVGEMSGRTEGGAKDRCASVSMPQARPALSA
ncbi:MAG: hypothetical protein EOS63_33545 [Mesorhizobium sp.]|nr:MAG: hypothetical protein EOS63_33545 [Mesorhizobium sp.]